VLLLRNVQYSSTIGGPPFQGLNSGRAPSSAKLHSNFACLFTCPQSCRYVISDLGRWLLSGPLAQLEGPGAVTALSDAVAAATTSGLLVEVCRDCGCGGWTASALPLLPTGAIASGCSCSWLPEGHWLMVQVLRAIGGCKSTRIHYGRTMTCQLCARTLLSAHV